MEKLEPSSNNKIPTPSTHLEQFNFDVAPSLHVCQVMRGGGGLIFRLKEISVPSGNKYVPLPIKTKERNLNKVVLFH